MPFWKNNTNSTDAVTNQHLHERLESAQHNLFLARRRVLGAAVLLSLSFAFLPWVLDDVKRNWNEDVILRMPKDELSYKIKSVTNVSNNINTNNINNININTKNTANTANGLNLIKGVPE